MTDPVIKTILIADEDPIIRLLVTHIFTRRQVSVEMAADAQELAERLEQHDYDAILLDVGLPGELGPWLRSLAERRPSTASRIILLDPQDRAESLPVLATLRKPLELDVLIETVEAALAAK